jgi:hypothetical protein
MATTAPKTTRKSLKPCACSQFYAETAINGNPAEGIGTYDTQCNRQTRNVFAQGHDAKLVSFLVKADMADDIIRWRADENGTWSAEAAAGLISSALSAKAAKALLAALDRKAAQRTAAGQPKPKAPRQVPVQVVAEPTATGTAQLVEVGEPARVKVGRWVYDGHVMDNGDFVYKTAKGEHKTAHSGAWFPHTDS